jgi:Family of unknown function (DUF6349)
MSASQLYVEDLWSLLAEHDRLQTIWQESHDEQDRRRMVAAWSIGITQPGDRHLGRPGGSEARQLCTPTVLGCHWLPVEGQDYWSMPDHLGYRGACLGCGWVCGQARRGRGAENLAVEDALDHTHPGWRQIPVLPVPPQMQTPASDARLIARWREQWVHLLPAGWLQRGGPIRTHRTAPGDRHVPHRAPGGGYDLAADESVLEIEGGQLCLL